MIYLFITLLGLAIGSFLNVCIARLPEKRSIVLPGSRCPHCQAPIKLYDNIPVLSFILLRGHCRCCEAPISWIYPLVESLTALVFILSFWQFGLSLQWMKLIVFDSLLIALIFTDIKFRLLPNVITLPSIVVGLAFSFFVPLHDPALDGLFTLLGFWNNPITERLPFFFHSPLHALLGTLFGAGALFCVAEVYFRLRKVEGMGMGDVKMMGMVGAFLGIELSFYVLFLGSLIGTLVGIFGILRQRHSLQYELPFGAFLGMAALALSIFGNNLLLFLLP